MKGLCACYLRRGLLASRKWSGHDADTFEMDFGGRGGGCRFCRRELIARATDDPRRLDHSGRGIEILDDAQAGGISQSRQDLQCRMDAVPGYRADDAGARRRRARLRHAGAVVARQRRGRRKSESLHRGAARLRKARRLLGLLGRDGRFPDQEDCRPQGQDRRHLRDRRRHLWAIRDAAAEERRGPQERHQAGRGRFCGFRGRRTRCARAAWMP